MSETYSRVGSILIKKEVTANVPVIPDVSLPFNDEGISDDYGYTPSVPISSNRAVNQRAICNKIAAPVGPISLNIEPKTFGHILNGLVGGLLSGTHVPVSSVVGTFDTTNVVTFVGSGATATPVFVGDDFIIFGPITGSPEVSDTLSQAVSSATSAVDAFSALAFGHAGKLPAEVLTTYSLQKNYSDRAIRYMGVKFNAIDAFAQSDNIMTAGVQIIAQSAFRHGRVTAITSSSAGSQTISVDQTQGLVAADSIKLYRPGTGFIDFSAASVKTHTIDAITNSTSFTITNLETSTAVGDLILLAPQTASYVIADEFCWVGGSQAYVGVDKDNLSTADLEDYTMVVTNEFEERHTARGKNLADRFPSAILQKGLTGGGSMTLANENEDFYKNVRLNTSQAIKIVTESEEIATGINYKLEVIFAEAQYDQYQLPLAQDDVVNEEVPFTSFYDSKNGYSIQVLLVNTISSY